MAEWFYGRTLKPSNIRKFSMKTRHGFRPITIDGVKYIYNVSLAAEKVIYYDENDMKVEIPFASLYETTSWKMMDSKDPWRGKARAGVWGKPLVAALMRSIRVNVNGQARVKAVNNK